MKKILTLLVSTCSGLVAFAQPQLKSNNLTIGDEFSLYSITNISPSTLATAGANKNWSISAGTSALAGSIRFMDPSSTPFGALYTDANFAFRVILGTDTVFHLFKNSAAGLEEVATDLGTGSSPDIFLSYRTLLPATFNFSDSIADNYQKQGGPASVAYVKYDAWGTLTTADSSYSNLGRTYRYDTQSNTNVIWWTNNGRTPIMLYDGYMLLYWKKKPSAPTSTEQVNASNQVTLYPNPANNLLHIICTSPVDEIEITDMQGKQVQKTWSQKTIDVSALKSGMYLVKVTSNHEVSISKFQKQ
ncbi:MAG TPA: T9SS type A sorting domain-containing protein [Bacteroidia bacterium]|nr:T9SS type A sorting domain-containing protein [Bacteroidia bacterium]